MEQRLAKSATKLANKVERDNPNTFNAKKKDESTTTYRGQGVGRKEKVGGAPTTTRTKEYEICSTRTQSAKTKTKRDKLDDLIAKVRSEQVINEDPTVMVVKKPSPLTSV